MPACRLATVCTALVSLTLAIVACSGDSQSDSDSTPKQPDVVRLASDPSMSERSTAALTRIATSRSLTVEASAPDTAHIVVAGSAAPGAEPFVVRRWAPVVALSNDLTSVTMEELRIALFSSERGGVRPVEALLPSDQPPPLDQWWPGTTPFATRVPTNEIVTALDAGTDAIALLPLSAIDSRVRTLAVDGVNVVFGEGDIASYPLVERGSVVAQPQEDSAFSATLEDLSKELASALSAPAPDPIILRATGDIIPARCVYEKHLQYNDFSHAFRELGSWLAEADVTVGSLDAAVSDAGVPYACQETFSLLAPAASADGFALAGFDVMTVATNHVKDCGQSSCGDQAFFETLANLRSRDIKPVGGGATLAEARAPAIVRVRGVTFGFLGYDEIASYYHAGVDTPGTAPLNEQYLREDVAAAAGRADVVIVLPQWGVEYTADPNANQRALALASVDAGADIVIGNHPHWVQAAETMDDVFIAYALGNFVFDQDWSVQTQQGVVLEAAFFGEQLKGVRYYPVSIVDMHQPVFAGPDESAQILDRIWTASAALE
jgi:poly-gamma-glutamate capsule biosynthesis protein CapA/YwtB (metallophosphatase superfamily)